MEQTNLALARLQWTDKPDEEQCLQVTTRVKNFAQSYRFLAAAAKQDCDAVSKLLNQGVDPDVPRSLRDQTALHIAVQNGDIQMVRLLLGKGGADIALQDSRNNNAIHFAVEKGNVEVARKLLEKNADPKALNKEGRSAIDLAKRRQDRKEIQSLLEHRPLVEGPKGVEEQEWTEPKPPTDEDGIRACRHFRATLAEFYSTGGREKRVIEKASVFEVLYEKGPESILNDVRDSKITDRPKCRWIHIPANNVRRISC